MTRPSRPAPPKDGVLSRDERLRAALRANLARRKAQARSRSDDAVARMADGINDEMPGKASPEEASED